MPKIIKAFPPNFTTLTKHFPIKGRPGIVYAYGDRIYNPSGGDLAPQVIAHETVHCNRQIARLDGVEGWWEFYIESTCFRLLEELAAHRVEWANYSATHSIKDAARYLDMMVARISGPLYKHMIEPDDARRLICQ
jgi:hypothetical protein